jgi:carotenoid 1,2-hydratase
MPLSPNPSFDRCVAAGGYAWWYVDALSDDGRHGLAVIAMIGSAFSPYYARARRRGAADPLDHSALNVALYGPRLRRWAMTERPASRVHRDPAGLEIGPSAMRYEGDTLRLRIDERTAPWPRALRGVVDVWPRAVVDRRYELDAAAAHRWRPIAPSARVRVRFDEPATSWEGEAYWESNEGDAPLESAFASWCWSRAHDASGATILYDVARQDGSRLALALAADDRGRLTAIDPPCQVALPRTRWGIRRATRCDEGFTPRVSLTLEDGPFYARSVVRTRIAGREASAVHESLSLQRFAAPWVRALLPVRMPRSRA